MHDLVVASLSLIWPERAALHTKMKETCILATETPQPNHDSVRRGQHPLCLLPLEFKYLNSSWRLGLPISLLTKGRKSWRQLSLRLVDCL